MSIINGWLDCWEELNNWWLLLSSPYDQCDQAAFFFYLGKPLSGACLQLAPWDDYLYYGDINDIAWNLEHDSRIDVTHNLGITMSELDNRGTPVRGKPSDG